ncbi:uncharacterized protein J4E88_000005 [Alternaria novae-zelandiae]|uniref:uncharacterized protein n=1 Tax=Alternaria novae-zelandiae TaxID=430562 RepID=UPI0020C59A5D|nr:uncharacterized protein J4E88_000005 [Alternaria novae-zelandiae]KAI4695835.1 hypothetical protein J4E88_000005 [Alternaria novae-zelandiae]
MTQPIHSSTSYTSFPPLCIAEGYVQGASGSDEERVARVVPSACDKGLSPSVGSVDPSTPDYSPDERTYLITTAQVPWRVTSPTSFYRDAPGSLEGWPSGTNLWPARGSSLATPVIETPSTVVRRRSPRFAADDQDEVEHLLTPLETRTKQDERSPVDGPQEWDCQDPYTWPIVYLPFHLTPNASVPSHIDEMLIHVHFKGLGARLLHNLLYKAKEEMETEEEKTNIGRMAFDFWPFNFTQDGWWKGVSGISPEDVYAWKVTRQRDQGRGFGCVEYDSE